MKKVSLLIGLFVYMAVIGQENKTVAQTSSKPVSAPEKIQVAEKPVTISGVFDSDKFKVRSIKLLRVRNGEAVEIGNTTSAANGKFGFLFYPEYEGLYVIGTGSPQSPNNNHVFYFKGGDKLSVEINDWDYKLKGTQNSKENVVMAKWHSLTDSIFQKAIHFNHGISTYVDFFPVLEATTAKAKNWLKDKTTGNQKFDKAMPGIMQMDMFMYATNFLQTPRPAHPSIEELSHIIQLLKQKTSRKQLPSCTATLGAFEPYVG